MCQKSPSGGTGVSEVSEWHRASGWSGTVGHSPCAWCQLLGECECLYLPKLGVCGVCVCIHRQTSSWTRQRVCRGLRSRQGYQMGGGSMLVFGGTHECGLPVGRVCECCVFAVSTQLDQLVSWGPIGQVRGAGIQAEVPDGQRGRASTQGIHECACACEPGECRVCAALVTFCGSLCDQPCRCPLCMRACFPGIHAQLHYWLNLQT